MKYLAFIIVGISCGALFAHYQFCFATAVRNLIGFGRKEKMALILIMIIASAVLFNFFLAMGWRTETVKELMPMTFLGGILFGFGMILAGGCTAGTLFRLGEGNIPALISTLGMIAGMATFGFVVARNFTKQLPHFVGGTLLKTLNIHPLLFSFLVLVFGIWGLIHWRSKSPRKSMIKTSLILGVIMVLNAAMVYQIAYFKYSDCQEMSPLMLSEIMEAGEDVVVVDIRPQKFFDEEHIDNAIALQSLPNGLNDLNQYQDKVVVVVCGEGIISKLFCIKLSKRGFKKSYNLRGGMSEWNGG